MNPSLTSVKFNGKSHLEYFSELSGWKEDKVRLFFDKFQVDREAPYYHEVIENSIYALTNHVANKVLASLLAYQDATKQLEALFAPPSDDRQYAAENETRQIALGILSISECPEQMGAEKDTYALLWSCMILVILQCDLGSTEERANIVKASKLLRQAGPGSQDKSYRLLAELTKRLNGEVGGPHSLFSVINDLRGSFYPYLKKLLLLIDLTQVIPSKPISKVTHVRNIELLPDGDNKLTGRSIQLEADPNEIQDAVIFSDPDLDRCIAHTPDKKSQEILKKSKIPRAEIKKFDGELKELAGLISRFNRRLVSDAFKSGSHLMTTTSLYSPYERAILKDSLDYPEKYGCSTSSALLVGLSICTVKDINEVLALKVGVGAGADISPEGVYYHTVPNIPKSAAPDEGTEAEYVNHVNDSQDNRLPLQLPASVTKLLNSLYSNSGVQKTIEEIVYKLGMEPEKLIKDHMQALNQSYGQRFSANRVRNQLRAYITAKINDPCITYVLTGNEKQRIPTALYYRAIPKKRVVGIYKDVAEEYFTC